MRVPFAGLSWDFRIGNERIKRFSSFQSFSFYSFFFFASANTSPLINRWFASASLNVANVMNPEIIDFLSFYKSRRL